MASNESKRRKMKLRKLLDRADALSEQEHSVQVIDNVNDIICTSNEILNSASIKERASNTDEVVLDAKLLLTVTKLCRDYVEAVDINVDAYVDDEFANHLNTYLLKDADFDWNKLEDEAVELFKRLPNFQFLHGTFENVDVDLRTQPKVRRARARLQACAIKEPEVITQLDKLEEGVDETVKTMLKILKEVYRENDSKPISYYNFIINPFDFGQTIENVFHFAFLIRDGAVEVTTDENGAPLVNPVSSREHGKRVHEKHIENTQRVMSLDMDTWQEIITSMSISKSIYSERKSTRRNKI